MNKEKFRKLFILPIVVQIPMLILALQCITALNSLDWKDHYHFYQRFITPFLIIQLLIIVTSIISSFFINDREGKIIFLILIITSCIIITYLYIYELLF